MGAEIEDLVRKSLEKLERTVRRLQSCRVAIECTQRNRRTANPYRIRIDLTVPPGHEVVVNYETKDTRMSPSLAGAVRGAFDAATAGGASSGRIRSSTSASSRAKRRRKVVEKTNSRKVSRS